MSTSKQPIHSIVISFPKEYDNAKALEFRTGLVNRSVKHTTSKSHGRITSIFINTWTKATWNKAKKWLEAQGVVGIKVLNQALYAGATQ